jgi:hypothetical protein
VKWGWCSSTFQDEICTIGKIAQWPIVSYRRWTTGRKSIDHRSHGAHLPAGSLDSGLATPIEQRSRSDTIGRRERRRLLRSL